MKKINLEDLEKAEFKIEKGAFKPKALTCSKCKIKMKKAEIEVSLDGGIYVKLDGFKCPRCRKEYLGLDESRKLDRAMILSRIMKHNFKMERSLSFDGDNLTFRIPREFTHSVHKRKIEIMPLGAEQFCAWIK